MRKTALSISLAGMILAPAAAFAQASVDVHFDLPVVLPRLVVVSPGVEVVPDQDYEVFHANGWYWVRQDGAWYRSRNHRGGWVLVPARRVPPGLARIPPGHYRHWRPARPAPAAAAYGVRGGHGPREGAFRHVERGGGDWKHGGRGKGHGRHD